MKTIYNAILIVLSALFLGSCSSLTVNTDYDRTADFSKYKTFTFYELADKSGALSELNKNRIIDAVKKDLTNKGFKQVISNADILINVTTVFENKQSVTSNTNVYSYGGYYRPYRWGTGYSGSTTYDVRNYKEGSLIIDIIDGSNKQLVWQGTGNKEIDTPSNDPDKSISDAVTKIMVSFPVVIKK